MPFRRSDGPWRVVAAGLPERVTGALSAALASEAPGARMIVLPNIDEESIDRLNAQAPDAIADDPTLVFWDASHGVSRAFDLIEPSPDLAVVIVGAESSADGWMVETARRGGLDALTHEALCDHAAPLLNKLRIMAASQRSQRRAVVDIRTTASQLKARNDRLESELCRLEAMAWSDPLTGLANRRQLAQRLPQLFAEAVRYGKDLACLMIDVDHFKAVNDRFGHGRGDELLTVIARLISSRIRTSDIASRYGGDEFVVLMPQTSARTASFVAQRLVEGFDQAASAIGCGHDTSGTPRCGMSIGVSCLRTSHPIDGDDLISQADSALLAAKSSGKGRIMVWKGDGAPAQSPDQSRHP